MNRARILPSALRAVRWLLGPVLALAALGCENKCDELVTVLTDCVSGEVGAAETDETEEEVEGDNECSSDDSACATCVLESKMDLCVDYGTALAECRAAGSCE